MSDNLLFHLSMYSLYVGYVRLYFLTAAQIAHVAWPIWTELSGQLGNLGSNTETQPESPVSVSVCLLSSAVWVYWVNSKLIELLNVDWFSLDSVCRPDFFMGVEYETGNETPHSVKIVTMLLHNWKSCGYESIFKCILESHKQLDWVCVV